MLEAMGAEGFAKLGIASRSQLSQVLP